MDAGWRGAYRVYAIGLLTPRRCKHPLPHILILPYWLAMSSPTILIEIEMMNVHEKTPVVPHRYTPPEVPVA